MKQLRWAALGLMFLLPLVAGCDAGTTGGAVATVTALAPAANDAANSASLTATALAPAVNDAANGLSLTATALAPTVSSAATAVNDTAQGASLTATALAPTVSGAATAATTALSGSMSAEDQAYLQKVRDLATKLQNAPEMSGALQALTTAATQGATGGTVDTAALTSQLQKASTVVNDAATQAAALQPPADMQSVQTNLMKAITDWQGALTSAQTAVQGSNWTDGTAAAAQMTQAVTEVGALLADLAARGVR